MYFGSVRFFKNLILLVVIILIVTPTVLAVRWRFALRAQRQENQQLTQTLEQQAQQYREDLDHLARLEDAMEVALTEELQQEAQPPAVESDAIAYQQLYPDFYAPQELNASTYQEGVIYLTFDDGPSDRTPEVLEILREKNVKATFFVVGQTDEEHLQ